jgi:hypothetical protein
MSLNNLLNVNTVTYTTPDGQDKASGALKYGASSTIKGRFGEATSRFDTQEAVDQVSDASFSSFELLEKDGQILFEDQGYLIVDSSTIRKGDNTVSHYNYTLKSLDNSNV